MITFFAIIQSSVISGQSVFYFPARLTGTWHGKKEIKMIILWWISSPTAIKIHIIDKLYVTVLHPTLIRHPKLIRSSIQKCTSHYFSYRVMWNTSYSMPETIESGELCGKYLRIVIVVTAALKRTEKSCIVFGRLIWWNVSSMKESCRWWNLTMSGLIYQKPLIQRNCSMLSIATRKLASIINNFST